MSINVDRILELSKTVQVQEDVEGYTAFAIAGVINETLEMLGSDYRVTTQYTYNDSRNGKINGVKPAKGEKVRYTDDEVEAYVAKFVANKVRNLVQDTDTSETEVVEEFTTTELIEVTDEDENTEDDDEI